MELRHLRYFVAVAEEEHLGRAARRLHVSPPPLSKQLRQLEEELRVPLFARVGRGLKLTGSGRVFLERARAVLVDVARAATAAQAAASGEAGHLTIGFVETSTYAEMVPDIVMQLRRRHPGVAIEMLPIGWGDQISALLGGRIDAALCNHVPQDPAVRAEPLLIERMVVALPRQHPLARNATVSARDLRGEPFVWIPRAELPAPFRRSWEQLAARGFAPDVVVEARDSASRLGLVAAGMGLTFVLESTRSLVPRKVVLRPISDVQLEVQSVLAWRAEDDTASVVQSLREAAQALAAARRRGRGAAQLRLAQATKTRRGKDHARAPTQQR